MAPCIGCGGVSGLSFTSRSWPSPCPKAESVSSLPQSFPAVEFLYRQEFLPHGGLCAPGIDHRDHTPQPHRSEDQTTCPMYPISLWCPPGAVEVGTIGQRDLYSMGWFCVAGFQTFHSF